MDSTLAIAIAVSVVVGLILFAFLIACFSYMMSVLFSTVAQFFLLPFQLLAQPSDKSDSFILSICSDLWRQITQSGGTFGNPILILLVVLLSINCGIHIQGNIDAYGMETAFSELIDNSSITFFQNLIISFQNIDASEQSSVGFSVPDLLTNGLNILLTATLADFFMSLMHGGRTHNNQILPPVQFLYSAVFVIFSLILGNLIPDGLFSLIPERWWDTQWIHLPEIVMAGTDAFSAFVPSAVFALQWSINAMLSLGVLCLLAVAVNHLISNFLSAIACGALGYSFAIVGAILLTAIMPDLEIPASAQFFVHVILIVTAELLFVNFPFESIVNSIGFDEEITKQMTNLESAKAEIRKAPINFPSLLFSGSVGGPFFWFGIFEIISLCNEGFSMSGLAILLCSFSFFLFASIPCIISAFYRRESGAISYFISSVCILIPLILFIYFLVVTIFFPGS